MAPWPYDFMEPRPDAPAEELFCTSSVPSDRSFCGIIAAAQAPPSPPEESARRRENAPRHVAGTAACDGRARTHIARDRRKRRDRRRRCGRRTVASCAVGAGNEIGAGDGGDGAGAGNATGAGDAVGAIDGVVAGFRRRECDQRRR